MLAGARWELILGGLGEVGRLSRASLFDPFSGTVLASPKNYFLVIFTTPK
jgi:hypothetical protein